MAGACTQLYCDRYLHGDTDGHHGCILFSGAKSIWRCCGWGYKLITLIGTDGSTVGSTVLNPYGVAVGSLNPLLINKNMKAKTKTN